MAGTASTQHITNNHSMKKNLLFLFAVILTACGGSETGFVQTSYPTMTISKSDITVPLKYSANLKGTADVTIKPQVSWRQNQSFDLNQNFDLCRLIRNFLYKFLHHLQCLLLRTMVLCLSSILLS